MEWVLLAVVLVALLIALVFFKLLKMVFVIAIVVGLLFVGFVAFDVGDKLREPEQPLGIAGEIHEHANMLVYLRGDLLNLSGERYQSTEERSLSPFIHVHDGVGHVVHKHAAGVTLGHFFESLGMSNDQDQACVAFEGETYCNIEEERWHFIVNGEELNDFWAYQFNDLDRVLVAYGEYSEEEVDALFAGVPDDACIYSETCPERGSPPEEANCVGDDCLA